MKTKECRQEVKNIH